MTTDAPRTETPALQSKWGTAFPVRVRSGEYYGQYVIHYSNASHFDGYYKDYAHAMAYCYEHNTGQIHHGILDALRAGAIGT